jgi:hypothetical protein
LDWAYASDENWDAFHSNIMASKEGVKISDTEGHKKFGIDVRWNVEGFGYIYITADNGGEFINELLYRYCLDEKITFTRSRPYKKNDQAHVEQKNWSVVRHTVGYDRWETEQELALLESIYDDLRLYINFFQPVRKLMGKSRHGARVRKVYDIAQTPYQRLLCPGALSEAKNRNWLISTAPLIR